MGVYSVFIGENALARDKELLNPNHRVGSVPPEETLISCKYDTELNSAGSCTFVMPSTHPYISAVDPMKTEVVIAEIDNVVWFGRVTDTKSDFFNRLEVHCEGAYAYLNDSVQPSEKFYNLTPAEYLAKLLANHNAQVSENRQITLAFAKESEKRITGEFRYESTMDLIQKFQSDYEGYIYVLMSALTGKGELYWIDSRNLASSQPVTFGSNLLNLTKTVDYTDICTSILPLGADVEMEVADLDEDGNQLYEDTDGNQSATQDAVYTTASMKIVEVPLNLGMVEDGNVEPDEDGIAPVRFIQQTNDISALCINGQYAATYGKIVRAVTFHEAYDTATLRAKAVQWLSEQDIGGVTVDISAADLRFLDNTQGPFYLGLAVPVTSAPHGVSETLIITKIEADVVKVSKKIALGRLVGKTLSDIAGRGKNNYEVGTKPKKVSSVKKVEMKSSNIWFIPA